jgi:hypothetical protein
MISSSWGTQSVSRQLGDMQPPHCLSSEMIFVPRQKQVTLWSRFGWRNITDLCLDRYKSRKLLHIQESAHAIEVLQDSRSTHICGERHLAPST